KPGARACTKRAGPAHYIDAGGVRGATLHLVPAGRAGRAAGRRIKRARLRRIGVSGSRAAVGVRGHDLGLTDDNAGTGGRGPAGGPLLGGAGGGGGRWAAAGLDADGLGRKPFRAPELFDGVGRLTKDGGRRGGGPGGPGGGAAR